MSSSVEEQLRAALQKISSLEKIVVEKDASIKELSITNMKQYALIEGLESKIRELNFVIHDRRGRSARASPTAGAKECNAQDHLSQADSYLDWNAKRKEAEDQGSTMRKFAYSIADPTDEPEYGDHTGSFSRQNSENTSGSSGKASLSKNQKLIPLSPANSRSRSISPADIDRDKLEPVNVRANSPATNLFGLFSSHLHKKDHREVPLALINGRGVDDGKSHSISSSSNSSTSSDYKERHNLFGRHAGRLDFSGVDPHENDMSSVRVEPPTSRIHDRELLHCPPLPAYPKSARAPHSDETTNTSVRDINDVNLSIGGSATCRK